jgi:hypothetical protein
VQQKWFEKQREMRTTPQSRYGQSTHTHRKKKKKKKKDRVQDKRNGSFSNIKVTLHGGLLLDTIENKWTKKTLDCK